MPENQRSTATDEHFQKVLAAILLAEESGKKPDLSHICRAHPQLAERLRQYFRDRDGFDRVAVHIAPRPRGASAPAVPELAPGDRFGGYDIIKELGRGGMGVVYLARQRSANRHVALKVIRADRLAHLTPRQRREWLTRFRTEGQAAARVTDDRVVTVYEVGELEGRPFYSMRYVAGQNLAAMIEAGPMPNKRAALLMEQLARAVQAIHDEGVLHRDIKPHNMLVDKRGRVYVSDFGLAKSLVDAETLTDTGDMLGSPQYMSPEQAQDAAHVCPATDIYGLGATLYALLTGRPPFQGTTVVQTLYDVKHRDPVPPRRVNPKVARDLETLALKCLEKEPGRRLPSAGELADELQRYLEKRPIHTRPLGPAGHIWRWCRRNRVVAALSAAAVLLIALVGGLYWRYLYVSDTVTDAVQYAQTAGQEATEAKENVRAVGEAAQEREGPEPPRQPAGAPAEPAGRGKEPGPKPPRDVREITGLLEHRRYLKDMGTVQRRIDGDELTKARELLAKWQPQGKEDHRAWEWYFLDARCRDAGFSPHGPGSQAPLPGFVKHAHSSRVVALAWSPDGRRLASADDEGIIRAWDVVADKELHHWKTQRIISAVAWSPDGKRLAAACQGLRFGGGDSPMPAMPGGAPPPPPGMGRPGMPRGGQPARPRRPRGSERSNAANLRTVTIWDVASGQRVRRLKQVADLNPSLAMPLAVVPVNVSPEARAKLDEENRATMDRQNLALSWSASLAWGTSNHKLALADTDGKIQVWNLEANTDAPRVLHAHAEGVHSAAWSPDEKWLASVSIQTHPNSRGGDLVVKVWDGVKDTPVFTLPLPRTSVISLTCALAWADGGKHLKVVTSDGEIRIVDAGARQEVASRKLNVANPYGAPRLGARGERFVCSPDGKLLASIDNGGRVRIWDAATGQERDQPIPVSAEQDPMMGNLCAPAWDRDGGRLALGASNGTVQAVPVGGRRLAVRRLNALAWSHESRYVLAAHGWSPAEDESLKAMQEQYKDAFKALQEAARAGRLTPPDPRANVQPRGPKRRGPAQPKPRPQINVLDAVTGRVVRRLGASTHPNLPDVLSASPDGKWLAAATRAGLIQVWPLAPEGEPVTLENPPAGARPTGASLNRCPVLAWSPDSKRLAYAPQHQTAIRVWDADTRKAQSTPMAYGTPLRSLTWSPDGKRLAAAEEEDTGKVWDVTGKEVFTFTYFARRQRDGLARPVAASRLAWCRDGRRLAVAGDDGTVTIWDVDTGMAVHTFPGQAPGQALWDGVGAVAWSPDGKRLASARPDGTFLVWDTITWQEVVTLRRPAPGPFEPATVPTHAGMLAWSPDGWQLAFFGGGGTIWDGTVEKGQE
jgi:WD40 repeat protein/predicted Ser/Thr protein kinase